MLLGGALLAACAQTGRPPVAERSPVFERSASSYVVSRGDTLYSIAWRFGRDHKDLARANGISAPYTIFVGQRLRLNAEPPARPRRAPAPAAPPASRPAPSAASKPAAAASAAWRPPTEAPVSSAFGRGNRGIDYALEPRHRVRAAAAGRVVYAGNGLGGYRHLVIVKHDPAYLSAYSLNRPMAVREGQSVKAGQLLADMDDGGRRSGSLHFEIRRNGDPVDPASLIGR